MVLPLVISRYFQTRSTLIVMKDLSSEALVSGNARQMEHGVGIRHIVKVVDFRCMLPRFFAVEVILEKEKTEKGRHTEGETRGNPISHPLTKILSVFLSGIYTPKIKLLWS